MYATPILVTDLAGVLDTLLKLAVAVRTPPLPSFNEAV
jgi:hypothetical protein